MRETTAALGLDALLVTHPPNLRYLAGFDGSLGALLLTPSAAHLIVDGRYLTIARARVEAADLAHIAVDLAPRSLEETIAAVAEALGVRRLGVEGAVMTLARFAKLKEMMSAELVSTDRVVEAARIVKDDGEVETMREAGRRLSQAAVEALAVVAPGRTELEVAADVELILRGAGFSKPAFETIVASGPNTALPHARPTGRRLMAGDGVLLDFGGVYDGYCVDLTRTVQLEPASDSFSRIFAAVTAAHAAALSAVKPGSLASDVDAAARELLAREGLAEAFVHGTGHGLGLEVHEEPRITRAGTARAEVLRPGMVFTVEPGAYIPGLGGVRIEDDVLVTEHGCEMLTSVPIDRAGYGETAAAGRGVRYRGPAGE